MNWNSITDQPMPINTPILVTDGEYLYLVRVCQYSTHDRTSTFLLLSAEGVSGYEFDLDIDIDQITHWLKPELP